MVFFFLFNFFVYCLGCLARVVCFSWIGVRESGLFKVIMIAGFQIVLRNLGKMRLVCPPPNKSSFKKHLEFSLRLICMQLQCF